MITLYKKNTCNITSLLYGFHDCREINICREISKEFFAIDRILHCTISGKICDQLRNFKGVFCDRSLYLLFITVHLLYSEFCDRSQKILLNFRDRSIYSLYNFWKKLGSIAIFKGIFCNRSQNSLYRKWKVNKAINRKKLIWNFTIVRKFFHKL